MVLLWSGVCQITPHSRDPVYRRLKALTSNGDSLDSAWKAEAFNDNVVRCDSRLFQIHDNQCYRRALLAPAGGQTAEEIIDVRRPRIASHDGRCMSRDLE